MYYSYAILLAANIHENIFSLDKLYKMKYNAVYRIEFFMLVFDNARSSIYSASLLQAEWLAQVRSHAMYDTGAEILPEDRLIALSTCTYGEGDDRTLFVGRICPAE